MIISKIIISYQKYDVYNYYFLYLPIFLIIFPTIKNIMHIIKFTNTIKNSIGKLLKMHDTKNGLNKLFPNKKVSLF